MRFPTLPIKIVAGLSVLALAVPGLAQGPAGGTAPAPEAAATAPASLPVTAPVEPVSAQPPTVLEPSSTIAAPVTSPGTPAASGAGNASDTKSTQGPEVVVAQGKGLMVTSADKRFQIQFRARAQLRESFAHNEYGPDNAKNTNEIQVRTLRVFTQGYLLRPEFKYYIQLAFGSNDFDKDSSSPIFDAFFEYTKLRDLNVRFGQYFVPFDRARTVREFALQFVDRQIVIRELTLDRDVGLMFSSSDLFGLDSKLAYNLFIGGGDGKNRFADTANKYGAQHPSLLVIGRLTVRPFGAFDDDQEGDITRNATPKLAIGVAGGVSKRSSRDHGTTGTTFKAGTVDYLHAAADLVFKYRGFSLLTEYVMREADRKSNESVDGTGKAFTELTQSGFGYIVQGGQMLTDKLEATARWDDLRTRKGTSPVLKQLVRERGKQLGVGLNYYFNGHLCKLQADYFYIFGEDIGKASHALRAQIDATF